MMPNAKTSSRVGKKREGEEPAARLAQRDSPHFYHEPKRDGAGENTNEGERSGIDVSLFQCGSAKQRVARKGNHRGDCEQEKSCGFQVR